MKTLFTVIEPKDAAKVQEALSYAYKKLYKAQAKGIIYKNYAARYKSELATAVNTLK